MAGNINLEEKMINGGSPTVFSTAPRAGRFVRRTISLSLDDLIDAGRASSKGGYSAAGRALAKHGGREGSLFPKASGNRNSVNTQGQNILSNILNDPQTVRNVRNHAKHGNIIEFRAPSGQGARFTQDGKKFIGFIE